jgi:hypothetical protein
MVSAFQAMSCDGHFQSWASGILGSNLFDPSTLPRNRVELEGSMVAGFRNELN